MSLMLLFGGYGTAQHDHWANVRLGDIIPIMLPYAGQSVFCGYVRLLAYTYRDSGGDGLLDAEVQWIEPVTAQTPLRFISDGGAIPPPVIAQVSQVAEQIVAVSKETAALGTRVDELTQEVEGAVPKGRMTDNVVGAINDSAGGINAGRISTGALGAGAKMAADHMTRKNVARLDQIIRSGGKTAQELATLARGGQMSIPQVKRIEALAKMFGVSVPSLAADVRERVAN